MEVNFPPTRKKIIPPPIICNTKSISHYRFHEIICMLHEKSIGKISKPIWSLPESCLLARYLSSSSQFAQVSYGSWKCWRSVPLSHMVLHPDLEIFSPRSPKVIPSAVCVNNIGAFLMKVSSLFLNHSLNSSSLGGVLPMNLPLSTTCFQEELVLWCMMSLYANRVNIWSLAGHPSL